MLDKGRAYILPAIIILLIVTVYPLIYVFYLSLHRNMPIFEISKFVGLKNYLFLLKDERFWNALRNTLYFTGLSVAAELLLGLAIAVFLDRPFKGRGMIRAIVLIPWAIPTVVSAKMWEWIYNPDFGILNYVFGTNINWLGSPFWAINAAIFMDVWKTTPFAVLLFMAGLQVIPRELYQAAEVDGASSRQVLIHITLPLLKPIILVVLLFRTLDAFRVFDAIYVLTGGGPGNTTETLSIYAYKTLFQTLQFGYGSALSVIVFLCVGIISLFYVKMLTKGIK